MQYKNCLHKSECLLNCCLSKLWISGSETIIADKSFGMEKQNTISLTLEIKLKPIAGLFSSYFSDSSSSSPEACLPVPTKYYIFIFREAQRWRKGGQLVEVLCRKRKRCLYFYWTWKQQQLKQQEGSDIRKVKWLLWVSVTELKRKVSLSA